MGKRYYYPLFNRNQVVKILKILDFISKVTHGSHTQWEGYTKEQRRIVTVKKLNSDTDLYSPDLMKSMIRQSGLSKKDFYSYLKL